MARIPAHFNEAESLRDKISYVLSVMHKGSAKEIAAEVIELQGIASEDGVEEITVDIENELEKMNEEGSVVEVKEHRQKKRYSLREELGARD
jgi:hemerythrin